MNKFIYSKITKSKFLKINEDNLMFITNPGRMGDENGLSIDKSIYSEFEPYINDLVEKYLEGKSSEEKKTFKYVATYSVWKDAFINMANSKGYIVK